MATAQSPFPIRDLLHVCCSLIATLCVMASGAAHAQDAQDFAVDSTPAESADQRWAAGSALSFGSFATVDLSIGPDRRPRRSLRFRFDSATRAMRSLGVEADDCATVLRSSHRSTAANGTRSRPGLMLGLNCRFF